MSLTYFNIKTKYEMIDEESIIDKNEKTYDV